MLLTLSDVADLGLDAAAAWNRHTWSFCQVEVSGPSSKVCVFVDMLNGLETPKSA